MHIHTPPVTCTTWGREGKKERDREGDREEKWIEHKGLAQEKSYYCGWCLKTVSVGLITQVRSLFAPIRFSTN